MDTKSHGILIAAVLVGSLMVTPPPAAGAAEPPLCNGIPATHWGTSGNDRGENAIYGTEGDDVIHGLQGRDEIYGLGGNDIICGGSHRDWIDGGDGRDDIWGQGGHDEIRGGVGYDFMRGGPGNDKIWGNRGKGDTIWAGIGSDVCVGETEVNCEVDFRWGYDAEDWLDLIDQYWGDVGETENALIIVACESSGEPFVVGGRGDNYYGLFQHDITDWERRAEGAGFPGGSPFNPEVNIAAARWYSDAWIEWKNGDESTRWDAWSCRRELP
jgi:Ca2+-binding RTX toxin-like protein